MNNIAQQNQKKLGSVSFDDNKVRINYSDGIDSILFEDISSISYKSVNKPNVIVSLVCTFLGLIIMFTNITNLNMLALSIGIILLGFVLMFLIKIKFDNVIIESRGGKLLVYSVEFGEGRIQMDLIENEKRKH